MSNARKIADLLDSNGDVNTANLDNVPASDNASSLSSGTIPAARIGSSSITNAKLAADAVDGTKIADNSIGLEHLVSGTDGNLITYDASGDPAYVTTGTSGQVLTSGGVGVAPTFQAAAGGATALDGLSDATTPATNNYGLGSACLTAISGGHYNNGQGTKCLQGTSSGSSNTAMGHMAMRFNTTGSYNTAYGRDSLAYNTTGLYYTAVGYQALQNSNTANGRNVGIGGFAGQNFTTGADNSCIGYYAQPPSASSTGTFTLGNAQTTNLRCNDTSISSLSDERDKTNITDLPDTAGLELINKLRPVTFNWDRREWYEDGTPDGSKVKPNWRRWKPNSGLKQGFIAQEVQTAITGEKCLEDSMIVTNDNPDKLEFAPQNLLTNAIKAIQQLSAEVEILKSEIATLKGV